MKQPSKVSSPNFISKVIGDTRKFFKRTSRDFWRKIYIYIKKRIKKWKFVILDKYKDAGKRIRKQTRYEGGKSSDCERFFNREEGISNLLHLPFLVYLENKKLSSLLLKIKEAFRPSAISTSYVRFPRGWIVFLLRFCERFFFSFFGVLGWNGFDIFLRGNNARGQGRYCVCATSEWNTFTRVYLKIKYTVQQTTSNCTINIQVEQHNYNGLYFVENVKRKLSKIKEILILEERKVCILVNSLF